MHQQYSFHKRLASNGQSSKSDSLQIMNIVQDKTTAGVTVVRQPLRGAKKGPLKVPTSTRPCAVIVNSDTEVVENRSSSSGTDKLSLGEQSPGLGGTQVILPTAGMQLSLPDDTLGQTLQPPLLSPRIAESKKDFKEAYRCLQQRLKSRQQDPASLSLAQHLLSTSTIGAKKSHAKTSSAGGDIHDKLYQERTKYLERKRTERNSQVEEEFKQCTFMPNPNRTQASRSFK